MRKFVTVFWLLSAIATAQTLTTVTATLQDSAGQVWGNATWTAEFSKPVGGSNVSYSNGGRSITPNQTGMANSSGLLTVVLDDNIVGVKPGGTAWRFTICPNANVAFCNIRTLTITGATMDISAQLNAILTVPVVNSISTITRAYNDTEVNGTYGTLYINSVSNALEQCQQITCTGAGWVTVGGSGSGGIPPGTTGQFLFYNTGTTVSGTPLLITDGTTLTTTTFLNCPLNAKCLSTPNGGIGFNANGSPAIFNSAGANVGQLLGIRTNNTQVASLTAAPYANFNNTNPAAPTNGINLQWQSTQSGGVGVISAAIVGDGTSTDCFIGTGIFAPCNVGTATGFAGAATTNPTPCKALGGQNTLQATTTSDTGPGIAIGICDPSSGTTTILRTTGLLSGSSSPILGSGTCSIGQFVIVDPTTNGAITCTSTFTAGTVIGKAASNQTTIGFNVNIYLGLR